MDTQQIDVMVADAEFIVVDIVSHTAGVTWAGADNGDVA